MGKTDYEILLDAYQSVNDTGREKSINKLDKYIRSKYDKNVVDLIQAIMQDQSNHDLVYKVHLYTFPRWASKEKMYKIFDEYFNHIIVDG